MTHLPEHPHALVTGPVGARVVVNVAVFADCGDDDAAVVEAVRDAAGADEAVACCTVGAVPGIGDVWDGSAFAPAEVGP